MSRLTCVSRSRFAARCTGCASAGQTGPLRLRALLCMRRNRASVLAVFAWARASSRGLVRRHDGILPRFETSELCFSGVPKNYCASEPAPAQPAENLGREEIERHETR